MTYREKEKINLSIFDLSKGKIIPISGVSLDGELQVGDIYWANNERVIYQVLERVASKSALVFYGEMFGINIDGSNHNIIFGYRAEVNNTGAPPTATRIRTKKATITRAHFKLVDILSSEKDHILIKSTPYDAKDTLPTIYKLNINNGIKEKIVSLPLPRANAITDSNGLLQYSYGTDKTGNVKLFKRKDKKWQLALEYMGNEGGTLPISITDDYIATNIQTYH